MSEMREGLQNLTARVRKPRTWPTCSAPGCSNRKYPASGKARLCYRHFIEQGGVPARLRRRAAKEADTDKPETTEAPPPEKAQPKVAKPKAPMPVPEFRMELKQLQRKPDPPPSDDVEETEMTASTTTAPPSPPSR